MENFKFENEKKILRYIKVATWLTIAKLLGCLIEFVAFSLTYDTFDFSIFIYFGYAIVFLIPVISAWDELNGVKNPKSKELKKFNLKSLHHSAKIRWIWWFILFGVIFLRELFSAGSTFLAVRCEFFVFACLNYHLAMRIIYKEFKEYYENNRSEMVLNAYTTGNKIDANYDDKEALNLIEQTGKQFFVKYFHYFYLWNERDLIDIIQENYTEQSKIERILAAKKIFDKDLEILALYKIVNGYIDEYTRQCAIELLEEERQYQLNNKQ